jgi:hypothetical protein
MERKLVYIEWEDITSSDTTWRELEDAQTWADEADSIVRQTGFLIAKDDDYIVLTCSHIPGLELIGSVTRIPKSTVKYIKEIDPEKIKNL